MNFIKFIHLKNMGIKLPSSSERKVCAECGGKCCQTSSCMYLPKVDFHNIEKFVRNPHVAISSNIYRVGENRYDVWFSLTAPELVMKRRVITNLVHSNCKLWTPDGCSLPKSKKPTEGLLLVPRDGKCHNLLSYAEYEKAYEPYQDFLEKEVKRRTGKTRADIVYSMLETRYFSETWPEFLLDKLDLSVELQNLLTQNEVQAIVKLLNIGFIKDRYGPEKEQEVKDKLSSLLY